MDESEKKIGLFFGSFNPIHLGHLAIANFALTQEEIHEVWFVVSPHNPIKNADELIPEDDRLEMVKQAIRGNERLNACDIEFSMPKPSYTWSTLDALSKLYPNEQFVPIIGADNYQCFDSWARNEYLLSNFTFLVYPRTGSTMEFPLKTGFKYLDAPIIDICSTEIRERSANGLEIDHLVHQTVINYIAEKGIF